MSNFVDVSDGNPIRKKSKYRDLMDLKPSTDKIAEGLRNGNPKPGITQENITATNKEAYDKAPTPKPGMRNVFNKFGDIVPYISNIANSFRKPPMPAVPQGVNPVYGTHVNYSNQVNEVARNIRGNNANADRTLDENTAAAVRANSQVQGIRAINSIQENQDNTNAQLDAHTRQINAGIEGQNVAQMNQWSRDVTEGQVAQQREQSENLANAADKFTATQNQSALRDLDVKKLGVYDQMFKSSGVMSRVNDNYNTWLQQNKLSDNTTGQLKLGNGGYMCKYSGGGPIVQKLIPHPTYNFAPGMKPTASDSTLYKSAFDNFKTNNPQALKLKSDYDKYGIPGSGSGPSSFDNNIWNMDVSRNNAYDDALGKNVMTDQQVHDELYKPFNLPKDTVVPLHRKKFASGGTIPTPGTAPAGPAISSPESRDQYMKDLINYSVGSGANPMTHKLGRALMTSNPTPDYRSLITSMQVFNQRGDLTGLTPQQRIEKYYSIPESNIPYVEQFKTRARNTGSIMSNYQSSGNVDIQNQLAVKAMGGFVGRKIC